MAEQTRDGDATRTPSRQKPRLRASRAASLAGERLHDLAGKQAEGVVGMERTEEGWRIELEVLELHRIPETTDVLAIYVVELDAEGELVSYQRQRRYVRGSAEEE